MSVNKAEDPTHDSIVPGDKWAFDASVTACFDEMLKRSIPSYETMRNLVTRIGARFVNNADYVVDIGASRGEAIAKLVEMFPKAQFTAIEVSKPMADVLRERFAGKNVTVSEDDLRYDMEAITSHSNSLVLSVLTLQFIPIEYRHKIMSAIYDSMPRGGAFIFVEKILGTSCDTSELLIDEYHLFKQENGYSYEDIERKRASLEGVLVPLTFSGNVELMQAAGFTKIECFHRHLNFCSWVAIK